MSKPPVNDMSAAELREESVANLRAIEQMELMLRRTSARQEAIEVRLLTDPSVRLRGDELVPFEGGAMRVYEEVVGRRYVLKEEVDKRAGELDELAPIRDKRLVVESVSKLKAVKPGLAAELLVLAATDPFSETDEDRIVKATDKDTYPTVSKIEKAYGKDSAMIGQPAKNRHVVLERPGIGDKPLLIGRNGMIGLKESK